MADKNDMNQCHHPSCDCAVPEGEKYCSPHCEAALETEVICGCGHAACQTAAGTGTARVAKV
jgi:hypothetical protein